jgi:hypothetical protein
MSHTAFISCDSGFWEKPEGTYEIGKFTIIPCKFLSKSQETGRSYFVLKFNFEGDAEADNKGLWHVNDWIATEEAKIFIAWLATITRKYLDLTHTELGFGQSFGPIIVLKPNETIDESKLEFIFHIDIAKKTGTYNSVVRPDFSSLIWTKPPQKLMIPQDVNEYTRKLYCLPERERDKFIDACFSYQFSRQNRRLPSVGLVALVNCVEIMMRDEVKSGYCASANIRCPLKRDVIAKFRKFFEENIVYPLPLEKKRFLDDCYSSRSNFVHRALLGEGPMRGPRYMSLGADDKVSEQVFELESLVNAGLIEWLKKI